MKAISIKSSDGKIVIDNVPIPKLNNGEILIKNEWSQINPADINTIDFSYKEKLKSNRSVILGLEGVGKVVQVYDESLSYLINKRVAYISRSGTWAEYSKTFLLAALNLEDIETKENEIPSFVNPLTVLCMLDLTRLAGQKCVVQTGASSSCGKMFIKVCKLNDIKTINVVRRQEQVKSLIDIGADFVLVQSDKDFKQQFKYLMIKYDPKICFECVAGEVSGMVFNMLPRKSKMYLYGSLSLKPLSGISPVEVIYNEKDLLHLNFSSYMFSISDRIKELYEEMKNLYKDSNFNKPLN